MRAVITHEQTSATVIPDMAVWPWQEARASRTEVLTTLTGEHWYVLHPFAPAGGTMRLLFASEASAQDAYAALAVIGTLELANVASPVDLPTPREFRFVIPRLTLSQADGGVWVLDVDYTEIAS